MTWGKEYKLLQDMHQATGVMPKALRDRVDLDLRQRYYYEVFTEVSRDRKRHPETNAPLPLTTEELLIYCTFYGINDIEQRTTIDKHIHELDAAYLEVAAKKQGSDKEVKS